MNRFASCALTAGLMVIGNIARPAHAETFTLAEALGLAYETNPQLEAQRAAVRATDEEVAKALAGWRPSVTAQGSWGYERGEYQVVPGVPSGSTPREATVTVTQPLFHGDTIPNTRKAKALVEAGRGQLLATEETVLLNAVAAYFDVIRYQNIVKLEGANVQQLQQLLTTVQTRMTLGELSRTDIAQTQGRLNGAQSDLAVAQDELGASRAAFEHVIGRPAESLEQQPPFPVVPESYDVAEQLALRDNPNLLYVRAQAIAADYAVDSAFGALLPSLSLQGQYQKSSDLVAQGVKINALSVMAQLTIPLYQGGAEYAAIREAKEQRNQANFTTADAERQVREQLRTADEALRAAQAATRASGDQVAADQVAYEGTQQETRVGGRSILDVLIAEQDLVNAEISLETARRNSYVAAYQLLAGTGELTAKALDLPVKLYDPQEHYNRDATRWIGFGD